MEYKVVDFFIVGAPKCGTSTIHEILEKSGMFDLPKTKELHYFSYPEVANTYYSYEVKNNIRKTKKAYENSFMNNTLPKVDNSPSYLFNNASARRIYEHSPDAQIIVILRDPVERAISHYLMDLRLGIVDKPFQDTLQDSLFHKEYIGNSLYYESLEVYNSQFGKNFHIFTFDDLFKKNDLSEIIRLGVIFGKKSLFLEIKGVQANKFAEPRFKSILQKYRYCEICRNLYKVFPNFLKAPIRRLFYKTSGDKPNMMDNKKTIENLVMSDWSLTQDFLQLKKQQDYE